MLQQIDRPRIRASRAIVAVMAAWAALFVANPSAEAQGIQDVDSYVAVVTASEVPMRSGDMRHFYEVVRMTAGDTVLVTGESADWARIRYPAGLRAFLAQEDGRLEPDGETLTLIRPSRLRAVNRANADPTASWKPLLADPLPANTTLALVGQVPTKTDRMFYLVDAPSRAEGYVALSAIRRATPAESAAFFGEAAPSGAAPIETPAETDPAEADPVEANPVEADPVVTAPAEREPTQPDPEPTRVDPAVTQPAELEAEAATTEPEPIVPAETPAEGAGSLLEPMTIPGERPVTGDLPRTEPAEAASVPTEPSPAEEPVRIEQGGGSEAAAPVAPRPVMSVEDLEAALREVLAQPVMEAEVDPLLNEFRRTLDGIEASPMTEGLRGALTRRIAVLELRRDYQRTMRANEAGAIDRETNADELDRRINDLSRTDVYAAVGLLQPSTVYDGERLPLLYRVRSVDDGPTRTLGYIAPSADLDLTSMLGRIVGVVGFVERDEDRSLLMLRARRVNVVDPADVGIAPE